MSKDDLYATVKPHVVDFKFDDSVAAVFPDMIRRSVPGYETIIALLGCMAEQYAQPQTNIYDLGCSLGASTLSAHSRLGHSENQFIAVDNSSHMLSKCKDNLIRKIPLEHIQFRHEDVEQTEICNASVVIMNFTLQFIDKEKRGSVISKLYAGLNKGGALILSEKIRFNDDIESNLQISWHEQFKRANGYSEMEVSQKRSALENVMILDSTEELKSRLQQAGFEQPLQWFQSFNFCSFIAVK